VNRPGCYAEYLALPMTNVWHHAPGIDLEVAAIFDPFGNAVHTALTFPVLGEDVLITGAGPIGIMAAAVVRTPGARFVVITDVNPYRLELARKFGVTRALDVRTERIADVQKELGMLEGFDIGLEMSGNPTAFREMLGNMCHGARIAMLGIPPGKSRSTGTPSSSTCSPLRAFMDAKMYETWYQDDGDAGNPGWTYAPFLTHRFPFAEYQQAFDVMLSGNAAK